MIENLALKSKKYFKLALILLVILILFPTVLSINPFYQVEYGTVGVVSRFGKIIKQTGPGLHAKIPFTDKVHFYTTQKIIYETSEDPSQTPYSNINRKSVETNSSVQKQISDMADTPVDTSTKDGQQVSIRYTLRYRLDPAKILWIAENIGTQDQVAQKIVQTQSRSVVRNIAREYPAPELYAGNVFAYQDNVASKLNYSFEQNGVILDEFLVRQLEFSPQYVVAVEQKQIEQEKVKTEEFKAQQQEFVKQQKIVQAEGEAKAQELLKATIDPLVLQKMAIDKWNGILPTYVGSGSIPFINVK